MSISKKSLRPLLVITPGDPDGIGPEVTLKSLQSEAHHLDADIICVGAIKPFEKLGADLVQLNESFIQSLDEPKMRDQLFLTSKKSRHNKIYIIPPHAQSEAEHQTRENASAHTAYTSIKKAVSIVRQVPRSALVTGPVHKDRILKSGIPFRGHTELLAELCQVNDVTMMLANDQLKISLVTTHLAINEVSKKLTRNAIRRTVIHTYEALHKFWKIKHPKIALLALNPHAGEGGMFGKEEEEVIMPEIDFLKNTLQNKCKISGPFPADTLFALQLCSPKKDIVHATVCMYHDQGLIPIKLLDFKNTVNITLGLNIIRTSVDHGVAFDIAGKNKADPSSMTAALKMALNFIQTL